jgi:quercetin dioxygenase-like cupin family protein
MPLEIRRFGVGHRRPDGPPGTVGLQGQVIHSDARGVIAELAFRRGARIHPHSNPNSSWFVVIEGGGWVQVGTERTRVQAGEAVLWPPDEEHGAWTDRTQTMRAIVVEFAPPTSGPALLEGTARPVLADTPPGDRAPRGVGRLAPRRIDRTVLEAREPDETEGEPL